MTCVCHFNVDWLHLSLLHWESDNAMDSFESEYYLFFVLFSVFCASLSNGDCQQILSENIDDYHVANQFVSKMLSVFS